MIFNKIPFDVIGYGQLKPLDNIFHYLGFLGHAVAQTDGQIGAEYR